jgi:mannose-6-phosphate isomerase-like protein (cupin superfamily)
MEEKRPPQGFSYNTHLNILNKALEVIDVQKLGDACTDKWYNQTLCQVNESVVRLGIVEGEYHWHSHSELDEFFYVVDGRFLIDLEDRTVDLGPKQGFVVPKGVKHRRPEADGDPDGGRRGHRSDWRLSKSPADRDR